MINEWAKLLFLLSQISLSEGKQQTGHRQAGELVDEP